MTGRACLYLLSMWLMLSPSAHSADIIPSPAQYGQAGSDLSRTAAPSVQRDAYGALDDVDMQPAAPVPGSSTSASAPGIAGVSRDNISATQSGPGAAGLFTPNNPGNAAAYKAQLGGGLEGSPIVDGTGKNVVIRVPYATPTGAATYQQYSSGGITGSLIPAPAVGMTALPRKNNTLFPLFHRFNGSCGSPRAPGTGLTSTTANRPSISIPRSSAPGTRTPTSTSTSTRTNANTSISTRTNANTSISIRTRLTKNEGMIQSPGRRQTISSSGDLARFLGHTTGSIDYGQGAIVVFGTNGILHIDRPGSGRVTMTNGQSLPVHLILPATGESIEKLARSSQTSL